MKTIDDYLEILGLSTNSSLDDILAKAEEYKAVTTNEINGIKTISVMPLPNVVQNKSTELKQRMTNIVSDDSKGAVAIVNIRFALVYLLMLKTKDLKDTCVDLSNVLGTKLNKTGASGGNTYQISDTNGELAVTSTSQVGSALYTSTISNKAHIKQTTITDEVNTYNEQLEPDTEYKTITDGTNTVTTKATKNYFRVIASNGNTTKTFDITPTNVKINNHEVITDETMVTVDNVASKISISMDPSTYVVTINLLNANDEVLDTASVDLPSESTVVGGSFDDAASILYLTLRSGSTISIPLSNLISGLASTTYVNTKCSKKLDLVRTSQGGITTTFANNGTNGSIHVEEQGTILDGTYTEYTESKNEKDLLTNKYSYSAEGETWTDDKEITEKIGKIGNYALWQIDFSSSNESTSKSGMIQASATGYDAQFNDDEDRMQFQINSSGINFTNEDTDEANKTTYSQKHNTMFMGTNVANYDNNEEASYTRMELGLDAIKIDNVAIYGTSGESDYVYTSNNIKLDKYGISISTGDVDNDTITTLELKPNGEALINNNTIITSANVGQYAPETKLYLHKISFTAYLGTGNQRIFARFDFTSSDNTPITTQTAIIEKFIASGTESTYGDVIKPIGGLIIDNTLSLPNSIVGNVLLLMYKNTRTTIGICEPDGTKHTNIGTINDTIVEL